MTLLKGLYDRLVYEDEVGEITSLSGQHRALVAAPTAHQRREQFIAELVHRLPELLDAAAAGQPDASEKARAELELIRQLLIQLRQRGQDERSLAMPPQLLKSVHAPSAEVELRQTLLLRNGRGVTLTEPGRVLLEHARGALGGHVSIGLPLSLSKLITVPLTLDFRKRLPNAQLTLTEGFSVAMYEGLGSGRLDMAVLYNTAHSPEIETHRPQEKFVPLTALFVTDWHAA